ncbi:hypothetical protein GCM10029963_65960 [Micromonospora andamanensis]
MKLLSRHARTSNNNLMTAAALAGLIKKFASVPVRIPDANFLINLTEVRVGRGVGVSGG